MMIEWSDLKMFGYDFTDYDDDDDGNEDDDNSTTAYTTTFTTSHAWWTDRWRDGWVSMI